MKPPSRIPGWASVRSAEAYARLSIPPHRPRGSLSTVGWSGRHPLTIPVTAGASQRLGLPEREGWPYVAEGGVDSGCAGTQISVTSGVYGWVLSQSSDPPISMLRGVCIALTASCNDGTRSIWASPLLFAPSAHSQNSIGASGGPSLTIAPDSLWISSLG